MRIWIRPEFCREKMDIFEWKQLTDSERHAIFRTWNPYVEPEPSVKALIQDIVSSFRAEYPGVEMTGTGNVHGSLMLVVLRPFVFDKRKVPNSYLGIGVRYTLKEPVPEGFEVFKSYVWAPENYLHFVRTNPGQIRDELGDSGMNEEEMLDALVGKPFDDWIRQCQKWGSDFTKMQPGQRLFPDADG